MEVTLIQVPQFAETILAMKTAGLLADMRKGYAFVDNADVVCHAICRLYSVTMELCWWMDQPDNSEKVRVQEHSKSILHSFV